MMKIDFFILFFYYFVSILSTFGYGLYLQKIIGLSFKKISLGYSGLLGFFFLTIYSYFSNFFYAHGIYHNLIVLILGLYLFYLSSINKLFLKSEFKVLIIIFLLLYVSFLLSKSHDDFPYYHFPYTYYLTQDSSLIGVGNFNHGFRTPSSLFYFNSLFYLPIIKYYLFHIGAAIIFGSTIFIFFSNLIEFIKKRKIDYIYYFDLLSLIFILIFFYRLAEHGTDRSAQILSLLIISEIFKVLKLKKISNHDIAKFSILFSVTISLKVLYFLYGLLLVPVLFVISKRHDFKKLIIEIINNRVFQFSIFLLILVLITNFFNTGCFVYPIVKTCFASLDWSIPLEDIKKMALHYENWSKAGMTPNFLTDDPNNYVRSFNWINNWIDRYFISKVSDFLVGLSVLILIFVATFYSKTKHAINFDTNKLFIFLIINILLLEWFVNHPLLRYGGYSLIALCFFIPFSIILEMNKQTIYLIQKKTFFLLLIGVSIFILRNVDRIISENKKYNYSVYLKPYYSIDNSYFRIDYKIKNLIHNYNNCQKSKPECNSKEQLVKKKFNKYIYIREK